MYSALYNMDSQRWQQVKQIFQQAVELDESVRKSFLDASCDRDEELRIEVESLLSFEVLAQNFIEESAFDAAAKCINQDNSPSFQGKEIGSYKAIRELGRGGMGAVYLGERLGLFDQQVAIKIIKRGMDTDAILKRFAMERQILANLDHPNIAHLLDGGTTEDGLSYFVMEFIEGKTVNRFCEDEQLTIAERLEIFRKICSAVSYAHKNLVVHRDIKPSNVLVNKEGEPKLLDFGIAKLLHTPDSSATETFPTQAGLQAFTPEYASPEQIRGERITTSTDVYSLGVLLYELLTGSRPYRFKSPTAQDVVEAVCMTEPEKPSSVVSSQSSAVSKKTKDQRPKTEDLKTNRQSAAPSAGNRQLKGDLDTIILTALRKEPERRYSSVEQFSEDIRRYLEGLPVSARSDSLKYRTAKFIKRHAFAVSAAALIFVSLFAGVIATMWQARRAEQQRARAEKRFNDVRSLANALVNKYHAEAEKLAGATTLRQMMVRDAVQYLDALAADAGNEPALEKELASAYLKIGEIQGKPYTPNLNDTAGAMANYKKALAIFQRLLEREPENRELQADLSRAFEDIAEMEMRDAKIDEAITMFQKAHALREKLVQAEQQNHEFRRLLADSFIDLGDAFGLKVGWLDGADEKQRFEYRYKALECFRQTLNIRKSLLDNEPNSVALLFSVSQAYWRVGYNLRGLGYHDNKNNQTIKDEKLLLESIENFDKGLELLRRAQRLDPNNARVRRNIADTMLVRGETLVALGETKAAEDNYQFALREFNKLVAEDPANAEAQRDVVNTHQRLAHFYLDANNRPRAYEHFVKGVQIVEKLLETTYDKDLEYQMINLRHYLNIARK